MKKKLLLGLSAACVILSATACQSKPAAETTAAATTVAVTTAADKTTAAETTSVETTSAETTTAETTAADKTTTAETTTASAKAESEVAAKNTLVENLEQSDYKTFAATLQEIIAEKDIVALAENTLYPVNVITAANPKGILVKDIDELTAMADDIFTDDLTAAVDTIDTETLTTVQAGVIMGYDSGKAGLIIGIDETGKLGVSNISSVK